MPHMPGDTFVSQGVKYILLRGPKGNLRPYTIGPVVDLARKAGPWLSKLGWPGLVIATATLAGVAIWYACKDEKLPAPDK